ncbi:hypothetical protein JW960_19095 [candidate division KSB1 bacterium]|nr:hypothetical protein [candidate division KSB1 bacterium]
MLTENKKSIVENDVVLVHVQEKPAFFARVEKIVPDMKKGWWQVTFLMLKIPLEVFVWILDNEQIRGADFTMNSIPIRIEAVVTPSQPSRQSESTESKKDAATSNEPKRKASILSLQSKKPT